MGGEGAPKCKLHMYRCTCSAAAALVWLAWKHPPSPSPLPFPHPKHTSRVLVAANNCKRGEKNQLKSIQFVQLSSNVAT